MNQINSAEVSADKTAVLSDRQRLAMLWRLTAGYRLPFLFAVLAMTAAYLFMYAVPVVMKFAIDALLASGGADSGNGAGALADATAPMWHGSVLYGPADGLVPYLGQAAVASVLLTMVAGAFLFLRGRWVALGSEGVVRALRERVFGHLEHLPTRYHDGADTGDLVQRCTSDVETLRVFLAAQTVEIARAILLLVTVLPILFWLDARMAWLSMATMPLLFVAAVLFFRKVKALFTTVDESEAAMTTVLQENLTGIRVVKAFNRADYEIGKFARRNADFRENNKQLILVLGFYYGLSDLVCLFQIGLLLIVGAYWVTDGSLTVGTLFAFITYESMIIWPIRHLGRVLMDSGKAMVAIGRLCEILLSPQESQDELVPNAPLSGAIQVRGLDFEFESGRAALQDIDLDVAAGETIALMGPPGAGKTVLVQLLLRLHDYERGSIRLDGHELCGLSRKFVRSQVSVVMQEPFLYSASIADNLRVGDIQASATQITEATRAAAVHDSIVRFPRGYDSMVGERGVTLSGGQRQRLALARALLKEPAILVLDDALSAVDVGTEQLILRALESRKGRHTTLVIAHRLSTVMHADRIVVLDGGRIVQQGSHEDLLTQDGLYRTLCDIQDSLEYQIEEDLLERPAGRGGSHV